MEDWQSIKTEYITGDISYRGLGEKYGVRAAAIGDRAWKEGWGQMRAQYRNAGLSETRDAVQSAQVSRAARLQKVGDTLLKKIEESVREIDPQALDTKTIRSITAALKDLKAIQMIKSDADMREQEARIENLQKQARKEEDGRDVTVRLEGELEAYSG